MISIYHLRNSSGQTVYVGASNCPEHRAIQHFKSAVKKKRTPLAIRYGEALGRGERFNVAVVATVLDGEDWRAVERNAIREAWQAGEPILNVQGVRRAAWKGNDQDRDVVTTRWFSKRIKLVRMADMLAALGGEGEPYHPGLAGGDFGTQRDYLISEMGWFPGSLFDRMFCRLEAERRSDWQETDRIDDLGIAYPPAIYLSESVDGKSDESQMTADDYQWTADWFGCLGLHADWMAKAFHSHGRREFGEDRFPGDGGVTTRNEEQAQAAYDTAKRKLLVRLPDARFVYLERLRVAMLPPDSWMQPQEEFLRDNHPDVWLEVQERGDALSAAIKVVKERRRNRS